MESSTQSKYLFCYYFRLMNFIPRVVPIGGMGKQVPSPTSQKYDHHPHQEKFPLPADFPSHQIFLPSHQITIFMLEPNKNFNFSCSHCSCTIFIFLHTGHANFDFNRPSIFTERCFQLRKGSNYQNHSSLNPHHLIKNFTPAKILIPPLGGLSPYSLMLFGKPCKISNYLIT